MARFLEVALGRPLAIVLIIVAAAVVSRLARRVIKRTLLRLGSGGLQEKARSALRETDELSLRSIFIAFAGATVLQLGFAALDRGRK